MYHSENPCKSKGINMSDALEDDPFAGAEIMNFIRRLIQVAELVPSAGVVSSVISQDPNINSDCHQCCLATSGGGVGRLLPASRLRSGLISSFVAKCPGDKKKKS